MVLISGEAWPEVFTGGVVYVIGSMASPAPEPVAPAEAGGLPSVGVDP